MKLPRGSTVMPTRRSVATTALAFALAVAFVVAALTSGPAGAIQQPWVQIIGCSNSSLIFRSYDYHSTRHVAVNSAQGGASLGVWATEGSPAWLGNVSPHGNPTPGFDANYAAYGATMVWYPLCIRANEFRTNAGAYKAFKNFVTLLRKRTNAPLYVSGTNGAQPTCPHDQAKMTYVADKAVADGLAFRGLDIPAASAPDADNCHFDPILSTNVANAAIAFLDGT